MEYEIGSLADLISGKKTNNKPKATVVDVPKKSTDEVVKKIYKPEPLTPLPKQESIVTISPHVEEITRRKKTKNLKRKVKLESKQVPDEADEPNLDRERPDYDCGVLVKNIPLRYNDDKVKAIFAKCGSINLFYFFKFQKSSPHFTKLMAEKMKTLDYQMRSRQACIYFSTPSEALSAIKLNGTVVGGHHIMVFPLNRNERQKDSKKSIFLGNVPYDAEEEELWQLFDCCGEIKSVEIPKYHRTKIGTGIAYVNFRNNHSVDLALALGEVEYKNKVLRIQRNSANSKVDELGNKKRKRNTVGLKANAKKFKKEEVNRETSQNKPVNNIKADKTFQGKKFSDKNKKKRKVNKGLLRKKKLIKIFNPVEKSKKLST